MAAPPELETNGLVLALFLALVMSKVIVPYVLECWEMLADWLSELSALPERAAYTQLELELVKSVQSEHLILAVITLLLIPEPSRSVT